MTSSINANENIVNKREKYSILEDKQLLTLIGNKHDSVALTELYERYKPSLGRFLQRDMHETMLIEEVYNDVMLTIWRKANTFRGESKVSTWIFTIAYRTKISLSQKEGRHKHLAHSANELTHEIVPEADITLEETIQDAMIDLSEPHRTVIELSYFHGYNVSEIAAIVDCPQNTVKTRLFHARQKLKATIGADQPALGDAK